LMFNGFIYKTKYKYSDLTKLQMISIHGPDTMLFNNARYQMKSNRGSAKIF